MLAALSFETKNKTNKKQTHADRVSFNALSMQTA